MSESDESPPPVPDLPLEPEIREVFELLHGAPLEEDVVLRRRLEAHLDRVRAAAHQDDYLDIGLVERIGQALERLLTAAADRGEADLRLVQAAARYFIHEQDAIGDLSSLTGFDDDAIVVGVVARHLDLGELLPSGL